MRWPGTIPGAKTCREVAATIDLLPTFAALCGATPPDDRIIDGKDISPLMRSERGAKSPHEAYYYFWGRRLQAVRSGNWKLIFPHEYNRVVMPGEGGKPGKYQQEPRARIELSLYDLHADPGETKNLVAEHPDIVKRLEALAESAREDLGDTLTRREGKNVRQPR